MRCNRFTLFIVLLAVLAAGARADQFDDMIDGLRKGTPVDPAKVDIKLLKTQNEAPDSVSSVFNDAVVNLYLHEIKLSILDPAQEGGWPYRSFLIEDDVVLRKQLLDGLTKRFAAKPDSLLYYAMVCPALYDRNEELVATIENYLKHNDPFLYKTEQERIAKYWRPAIAATLKHQQAEFCGDMLKAIALDGKDSKVPATIATALGLANSGKAWPDHQVALKGSGAVLAHSFAIGLGENDDIVLSASTAPDVLQIYRVHRDGTLASALTYNPKTSESKPRDAAVAKADFTTEWVYWNDIVGDLLTEKGK
ncbi:MAG: hypothetical protein WCD79_01790 [Chthoniobacteraceae bacterium]